MIEKVRLASRAGVVSVVVAACTMVNVGSLAPERQTQRAVLSASYDDVYRAAIQQAGEMTWQVLFADKDAGAIRIAYGQTLGHWADTVAVSMTRSDSGVVVEVRSTLGQEPNRRQVQRYLEGLRNRLVEPPPTSPRRSLYVAPRHEGKAQRAASSA